MGLKLVKTLTKPGPLQRGISIFFLVFTFMDLVFIDVLGQRGCLEEDLSLSVVGRTLISSGEHQENKSPHLAFIQAGNYDQPARSNDDNPLGCFDEDCFCCCSHLIPSVSLDLAALKDPIEPSNPGILFPPLSPLRGTFHPPRLA